MIFNLNLICVLLCFSRALFGNLATHTQTDVARNVVKAANSKVIFDVTNIGHMNISTYLNIGFHTSSLMHYVANDNVNDDTCWTEYEDGKPEPLPCGMWFGTTGLSYLFNQSHISEVFKLQIEEMTNDTILNILSNEKGIVSYLFLTVKASTRRNSKKIICYCDYTSHELSDYLINKLRVVGRDRRLLSSVKLGLEYGENDLACCEKDGFEILKHIDYVVLRIEVFPETNLLSYGIFTTTLNSLLEKNRIFASSWNPDITLFVRLSIQRPSYMNDEIYYRYLAIIYNYIQSWSKNNNATETIIVNSFPKDFKIPDNFQFLKENVSPLLFSQYLPEIHEQSGCQLACETQGFVKTISSVFNNFAYVNPKWKTVCSIWTTCSFGASKSATKLITKTAKVSIILTILTNTAVDIIHTIASNAKVLNVGSIYFDHKLSSSNAHQLTMRETINLLLSNGIGIGCYVKITTTTVKNADSIVNMCGSLFNVSSYIVIASETKNDLETRLPSLLHNYEKAQILFKTKFPDKLLIPSIILSPPQTTSSRGNLPTNIANAFGRIVHTVYCDQYLKDLNEYYDSILTFANIHKWESLLLRPVLEDKVQTGWWRSIKTDERINRAVTNFPVLVRTNSEDSASQETFPTTYPCIVWLDSVNSSGIQFVQNYYSGVTFEMGMHLKSQLLPSELETMMLFTLGKFPTVEIVAWTEQDFHLAKNALSPMLINLLLDARQTEELNTIIYISTKLTNNVLNQLESFPSKLAAVTVTDWEKYLPDANNSYKISNYSKLRSNDIKYGISVDDCIYEMNLKLSRINSLPFIKYVNYVMCNAESVALTSESVKENTMTKYLDTLLYTKSYMEKFLEAENVEIIFRILFDSLMPCENSEEDVKILLKLLHDVNEYSKVYGIRFFVYRAFKTSWLSQNCISSWWHIKNYDDLTNISNYVEWESEHFGRSTKPGLQHPYLSEPVIDTNKSITKNLGTIIVIASLISVVFLVTVLAMWLNLRRMRERYLNEKELNEFYNGKQLYNDAANPDDITWLKRKFPESHEIPKMDIVLGRVIGSGEFGVVHYGTLFNQFEVAVKLPHPGSTKEQFKSVLAEVKTLSYLGRHSNVVLFLGACTKQIVRGKLYIVTEFCKNGSLLSYLRSMQSLADTPNNQHVDLYQLYNFSQQIAAGMAYISEKQVVHGDLSTRNVFLTEDFTCKIGDFGLARRLYELQEYVKESKEPLPWRWMAPETLKIMVFTTNSDVWSYGVTIWEIFSLGSVPYPGTSWSPDFVKELETGMRMGMPEFASNEIYDFLRKCWNFTPKGRPSFGDLLIFFSNLKNSEYTNVK